MSIFKTNLLLNKTAIITGGATGIGYNIANELLNLGCHVLIASRNESKLTTAVTNLRQETNSNKITSMQCDIRQPEDVEALMTHAVETFGPLDYLVNNGGGQFPAAAETINDKGWNAVINTNLNGTFRMCREAVNKGQMKTQGGSIVNIICTHFQGFPGMAHTGAARAGVDNLTKTLAMEWQSYGVRVNAVAPGVIYSKSAESNYSNNQKHPKNQFDSYLSSQAPKIPMRRLGTTQEVANVVTFLLSPGGSYTTGATYTMDGGVTCANVIGSDTFLRKTTRPVRNAFPIQGELPDFCIADDDRMQVMMDGNGTMNVKDEIEMLELKLKTLRGE